MLKINAGEFKTICCLLIPTLLASTIVLLLGPAEIGPLFSIFTTLTGLILTPYLILIQRALNEDLFRYNIAALNHPVPKPPTNKD